MIKKKRYQRLDFIRVVACVIVLFFHLYQFFDINIFKGGYLVVQLFLTLSGYLLCFLSFNKKEKFNILNYYKKKFFNTYFIYLIVIFLSIYVISLIPYINWLNLKPVTTSVICLYNNFYQASVNSDYFARSSNSPFVHFWYISILFQLELIFPFIFITFKKMGDKVHRILPAILSFFIGIISLIYFILLSKTNLSNAYFNTLTRLYPFFFGMGLGFIHIYYNKNFIKLIKNNDLSIWGFLLYLITIILLCLFIPYDSKDYICSMVMVSILSIKLIDYSVIHSSKSIFVFDTIIKSISSISYEIYLVQYPVIYIISSLKISNDIKVILVIIIVIIISYIIHFAFSYKKEKFKIVKLISFFIILGISFLGVYNYIITKDHTKEMKALEEELSLNSQKIAQKQLNYKMKLQEEKDSWNQVLTDLETNEKNIGEMVLNLPIVGIGDSVMLGASLSIYDKFPNAYVDAKVSRTDYELCNILRDLDEKNMLKEPIIINLGANGGAPETIKKEAMNIIGNRLVFWLNVTNDYQVYVNKKLLDFSNNYENLYVIDWNKLSAGHPEYFVADGIHLTYIGTKKYADVLYDEIYKVYLDKYNTKKNQIIEEYENTRKNEVTFYGNDLLINAFSNLKDNYSNANFITENDFAFETLKEQIISLKNEDSLSYNLVFVFDNNSNITYDNYKELIELCSNHKIYILNSYLKNLDYNLVNNDNVTFIDFYDAMQDNLMADKIHLTKDGNELLGNIISNYLKIN